MVLSDHRHNNGHILRFLAPAGKMGKVGTRLMSKYQRKNQADQSLLGPSLSRQASPFSSYSALVIQNSSLSFMTSASPAPPMNPISFLLGGSSILILNLASRSVSPLSTLSR